MKGAVLIPRRNEEHAVVRVVWRMFSAIAVILALPVIFKYMETGLVSRFLTALFATGMMMPAFLGLASGCMRDDVKTGRGEIKRRHYLQLKAPGAE